MYKSDLNAKSSFKQEEFENFTARVNEVTSIIKKLTATDSEKNEIGLAEADRFLGGPSSKLVPTEIQDAEDECRIKFDRSVISDSNYNMLSEPTSISQEAFMKSVEIDAIRRCRDRMERKTRADALKRRGNRAFRDAQFEKALLLYNEAIENVKDSPVLYTNRALTHMNLEMYEMVIDDCKAALKLDENFLKAWLYQIKSYYYLNNDEGYKNSLKEVRQRHSNIAEYIEEYVHDMKSNHKEMMTTQCSQMGYNLHKLDEGEW